MAEGQIVAGWIAPHGVVPDMPEETLSKVPATNAAMRAAAEQVVAQKPDSVVLITPHGFRAANVHTVSLCHRNSINLSRWYPWRCDEMTVRSDLDLARSILQTAVEAELPSVGLIYGGTSDPVYPMDWAITAPMRYLLDAGYAGSLVPITFTNLPFIHEWQFGLVLAEAIGRSSKRVAIIASSDLSHVHTADGPYGFNPIASVFDSTIHRALGANDIASLMTLDPEWVNEAAQDGLRSILILGGCALNK